MKKNLHTHYDNLKVARNATRDAIRSAYRKLAQQYHPDRHPDEAESTRIMASINAAYQVLSDPVRRARHDRWIQSREAGGPTVEAASGEVTPGDFDLPREGSARFEALTPKAKELLVSRLKSRGAQFRVKIDGVAKNYVWAMILMGWFVYLFHAAASYPWGENSHLWHLLLSLGASFFLAVNLSWIIRWHLSPLGAYLMLSPLYLIETRLDRVRFWPIWTISRLSATHQYKRNRYQYTELSIEVGGRHLFFTFRPETAYDSLIAALREFERSINRALNTNDLSFFEAGDEFLDCPKQPVDRRNLRPSLVTLLVFLSTFAVSGFLLAEAYWLNNELAETLANSDEAEARTDTFPQLVSGARSLLGNRWSEEETEIWAQPGVAGYVQGHALLGKAGASSVTLDNRRSSWQVQVKLTDVQADVPRVVRVVSLPAYTHFRMDKISPGIYEVRYRNMDTGEAWSSPAFALRESLVGEAIVASDKTIPLFDQAGTENPHRRLSGDNF